MATEYQRSNAEVLLDVQDLRVAFHTRHGDVQAVNGVNFSLHKGEVLGIVGESGCGKSVTVNAIMRLIGLKKHERVSGQINFKGQNLLLKSDREMQKIRGNQISMIFQDPMTSLNPVVRVGTQVAEAQTIHRKAEKKLSLKNAIQMLSKVGIPSAEQRAREYPHQFSGGMRQRGIIAMSLMCRPEIIIADEPTTALDVTIQAQILDLLRELRRDAGVSILLITHDLGVVAEICDTVAVMYASEVVETAPMEDLFSNPQHPYTRGLLSCLPVLGSRQRLVPIPGQPPRLINPGPECRFMERCPHACERCKTAPSLEETEPGHLVACWRKGELE